jgi:hypothetical protein
VSPVQGDDTLTLANLQPTLNRLGVKGIATHRWDPVVHPVAVVDGSIQAVAGQTLDVPFTAGEVTAPAANTRLANSGALVAGVYNLTVWWGTSDTNGIRLRRRNAGDTADIWSFRMQSGGVGGTPMAPIPLRVLVAVNEFFVVENIGAGGVGVVYQATIWVQGPF